ncbi:hypothetical protein LPU83_pLPU83d_0718 (plasmid) [Rhizobium favelukesii]|uniref:Uncharacterized protein n=1 Tax=Rhizobium favelukesii TaxID=348824 RepID=W6RTK6_9HYPH|nr:hypothetical protein LPU83_pLPU83d_0718 [Rhizobium favelukesii]
MQATERFDPCHRTTRFGYHPRSGINSQIFAMIDCTADEIALSRNSSEDLSTAIFGIPLAEGDQVLISPWDYPSVRRNGRKIRGHRSPLKRLVNFPRSLVAIMVPLGSARD